MQERPIRVAIIGGGVASITTAFELSAPEHAGRYDVTVYQQGWRIGGKGASGRGADGRIEEHGLHLWMGHYDNAFKLMRECYQELGRDPRTSPMADWTDAFVPDPYVGLAEPGPDGEWKRLMADFPPFPGLPGDPLTDTNPFTIPAYLTRAARLLYVLLVSARTAQERDEAGATCRSPAPGTAGAMGGAPDPSTVRDASTSVESLTATLTSLLSYGQLATLTGIIQAVATLELVFQSLPMFPPGLISRFLEALSASAAKFVHPLLETDHERRHLWQIMDLVLANIRGSIRFGLVTDPRGFDALNDYDTREWLRINGASQRSVESGFVKGLYDLAFAYEDGDPKRPAIAAGQGLRGCFRMFFTYRGSLFWKMQAGMGDVVFAPYYEVLRRRGVKFEFFHRLENVALADAGSLAPGEKPYVTRLDFDVQAQTVRGLPYEPLVDVKGLPCWPSSPDWSQLVDGERLRTEGRKFESFWDRRFEQKKQLHVQSDFDLVVLGVSLGQIPYVCSDFIERDPRWRAMVENIKTVQTQAFQLWMDRDMSELGWNEPPPNLSGYVEPFDTWADMSHLSAVENWPTQPRSIAYFCNVLPGGPVPAPSAREFPALQHEIVRHNAVRFLNRDIGVLWPKATRDGGGFRWEVLMDPAARSVVHPPFDAAVAEDAREERFDSQFWIANVNPTDRYVLSLPGTLQYRISPLDETYDNLTITGDWTDCGFNFGCVEAATMAGRLAAHAVSLRPALEDIFGYDHP